MCQKVSHFPRERGWPGHRSYLEATENYLPSYVRSIPTCLFYFREQSYKPRFFICQRYGLLWSYSRVVMEYSQLKGVVGMPKRNDFSRDATVSFWGV